MTDSPIAAAARILKERHSALLRPIAVEMSEDTATAIEAVEAARVRAQGDPWPDPAQLSLDVQLRGET